MEMSEGQGKADEKTLREHRESKKKSGRLAPDGSGKGKMHAQIAAPTNNYGNRCFIKGVS